MSKPAAQRSLLHISLILLAVGVTFSNILPNELHLDDIYRIQNNVELNRVWPLSRHFLDPRTSATLPQIVQYRPMLPLSLSINHALSDALGLGRLAGLHVGNIALHAATCVLLYLLFSQLLMIDPSRVSLEPRRRLELAFAATLLFAVHPISGVPVNYTCSRDLLLMMLFMTGSLLLYVRMRIGGDSGAGWVGVISLYALSLLSKQNSVVAPALVFLIEWLLVPQGGRSARVRAADLIWRPAVFAAMTTGFFVWTEVVLDFSDLGQLSPEAGLSPWIYALTMARTHVFYYLRNFAWPFQMRPLPEIAPASGLAEIGVIIGGVLIAATVLLAWRLRRRAPLVAFSILSYWVLFAPTSSVRPFRLLACDYRQYASLAFLCLGLVLAGTLIRWRRLSTALLLSVAAYFAASTFFHTNPVWRSEESLWGQAVRYGATPLAHSNFGLAILQRDPDLAEQHFRQALAVDPNLIYSKINLGLLLVRTERAEEGLTYLRGVVRDSPSWGLGHYWLAIGLRRAGDATGARSSAVQAAETDPRNLRYQDHAAIELQRAGEYAASIPYLERITAIDPDYRDASFRIAWAMQSSGRWPEAAGVYRSLLERRPDHVQARFNLGHGLMESGAYAEAIRIFEDVAARDPDRKSVQHWLARCYRALGNDTAAAHHAKLYAASTATGGVASGTGATSGGPEADAPAPDVPTMFLQAWEHHQAGRWPAAEATYRALLLQDPRHVQARFNLAHGLMEAGQYAEAIPIFEEVLDQDPSRRSAHHWLARCFRAIGDEAAAARHAETYAASQSDA